ncbi:DsbA family protein [Rhodosalinus sp. K401]|uniref:DsbA family protein n=1 Tax=Rhodosalinus sp. K401 TaxID=3239195 RepID=UPI0035233B5A
MTRYIVPAALALVLVVGGAVWLTRAPSAPEGLPMAAEAQGAEVDTSSVTEMALGDPDAPVTVIEYASFTCPHCASFHTGPFEQIKENYVDTGKVRFIHREVYFDKYGMWASLIARCAGPDRYFGIVDLIYDGQSEWSRAGSDLAIANELRKIGRMAGMDNDRIEACLTDADKLRTLVAWYQENATEHDIDATPSFVIDGEKYSNMGYSDFARILDEKLAGQ